MGDAHNEYTAVRARLRDLVAESGLSRLEAKLFDEVLVDLDIAVQDLTAPKSADPADVLCDCAPGQHPDWCRFAYLNKRTPPRTPPRPSKRPVWYMAHPVGGDVAGNLERARRWLRWLMAGFPNVAVMAPWISQVEVGNDADPAQRERGLLDCEATAARCDAIVLVGGRVSPGMQRELDAAREAGVAVIDMTRFGAEPSGHDAALDSWGDAVRAVADKQRGCPGRHPAPVIRRGYDTSGVPSASRQFCDHANEGSRGACTCPPDCYCRRPGGMCPRRPGAGNFNAAASTSIRPERPR